MTEDHRLGDSSPIGNLACRHTIEAMASEEFGRDL
jgi:hypothetical protein